MLNGLLTRLRGLLQRRRATREVDDELAFHLAMESDANVRRGMSVDDARRAARAQLGGVQQTKLQVRDVRLLAVEHLWQDARYAARRMWQRPGFTLLVTATLALGIGVNTAAVAVAYNILGRPLPYRDPSRLVLLNQLFPDGGDLGFSPETLQQWLPRFQTIDAAAGYYRREVTVKIGDRVTVVPAAFVTTDFFDVLGAGAEFGQPTLSTGRTEAVAGLRWWRAHDTRAASEAIRAPLAVSGLPFTLTGITGSDFAFPDDDIGLWLPSRALIPGTKSEDSGYSRIVARLKPGITLDQFRADADRVRLEVDPKSRNSVSAQLLGESIVGGLRRLLAATMAGALLVLVVACANVATLFIGRDLLRQRELGARIALGATTGQVVRGVLVETALTACLASVAGIALGVGLLRLLVSQADGAISGLHRVRFGLPVALAITALTVLVSFLCGAAPAWHASGTEARPFFRGKGSSRPSLWPVRSGLVIVQLALSCVLVIGAGLLLRTVLTLLNGDHGFRPRGALEAKFVLSDTPLLADGSSRALVHELVELVRAMPGVQHVGFGSNLPPRTPLISIGVRMLRDNRDEMRFFKIGTATPGYLPALGVRFIAGRDFEDADSQSAAVVILSESAERFYFPNGGAIDGGVGRLPAMLRMSPNARVVGVVSDLKYEGLEAPTPAAIYVPWDVRPLGSGYLVVRTADGAALRLASSIRGAAQDVAPSVPMPELQSLDSVLAQSIATRRIRALPAAVFGLLAVAVAFVGVLATLLTLVAERRREMAIRAALGASPGSLAWAVFRRGLTLAAAGTISGLGLGGLAARGLSCLVYGVSPYDAWTFAGAAVLVGGGAMLVTYVAATRARLVSPVVAFEAD